jgi:hypothetical protein
MRRILLSVLAAAATTVFAQTTTVTTTTRTTGPSIMGTGTVSEFAPGSALVLRETSGPVTYRYDKSTTFVTKSGRVLSDVDLPTQLRAGVPVSVDYDLLNNSRVVKRVIINDDNMPDAVISRDVVIDRPVIIDRDADELKLEIDDD